jgi:tetratricopeptide (TPR) repeat protein
MRYLYLSFVAMVGGLYANDIKVYENYGDLVIKNGAKQQKLIIPPQMKNHSRFLIRAKPEGGKLGGVASSTESKIEARRIMYQANQAFFKGEIEKTWDLIEQAEKLDPEFYRIKSMKGSLLYRIGSKDLAAELWKDSLEKKPDQPEIRALLEKTLKEL